MPFSDTYRWQLGLGQSPGRTGNFVTATRFSAVARRNGRANGVAKRRADEKTCQHNKKPTAKPSRPQCSTVLVSPPFIKWMLAKITPRIGGCADTADVSIALRMVLSMEGVECRPK